MYYAELMEQGKALCKIYSTTFHRLTEFMAVWKPGPGEQWVVYFDPNEQS